MSRFYAKPENIKKDLIYLDKAEAHHIHKVMRLSPKDKVAVFDGRGNEYEGELIEVTSDKAVVKIEKKRKAPARMSHNYSLAVGIPKGKKMELIIQKCSELGAEKIIPLELSRSVVHLSNKRAAKKISRWREIAKSASKQCGRLDVAEVSEALSLDELFSNLSEYDLVLAPCLKGTSKSLRGILGAFDDIENKKILAVIGPEGGFDDAEADKLKQHQLKLVSLGPLTLRTETAAIYVSSILNYLINK